MAIEHVVTSGTFSLDGGTWDVDNNVWIIGDDDEVVAPDLATTAEPATLSEPDFAALFGELDLSLPTEAPLVIEDFYSDARFDASSLLRAHGLRVGRYTSPHLASVRERI